MNNYKPTPIISIIIPVYNVKYYLCKCIESVLVQTFQDFEIILVDDGSTDGSGNLCDDYAQKDNRIRILHKENGGLASARKAGFEMSHGKYILNVDSDDWIEPNHLQVLYDAITESNADIAQSDYFINCGNKETICINKPSSDIPGEVILEFLDGTIHSGIVFKLIDRSLYEKDNFKFPPGDFNEDLHSSISLLLNAKKYYYVPEATYHYRMNISSLTHQQSTENKLNKYRQFMTNMSDLYYRLNIKQNDRQRKALIRGVNNRKRDLVKFFPDIKDIDSLLDYFPKSYSLLDIRSIGDIFFYFACNWKVVLPYKIKKWLR